MRLLLSVFLTVSFFSLSAIGEETDSSSAWPFFAFENGMRDMAPEERIALLKELGYDGVGSASPGNLVERLKLYDEAGLKVFSLYLGLEVFPDRFEIKPGVTEAMAQLKGRGETTVIELYVRGEGENTAVRDQAILGVKEVARLADESGLRVVLYPHTGFHIDTVGKAFELATAVDRPNVGVMFNLCHFLRVEPESDLREVLTRAKPLLWRVSTSGADVGGDNWGALIQPLDSGTYSQSDFFALLSETGFDGAVGLQCFGIKEESRIHLGRSITAWKNLTSP
ncbi:MAG: TIM barrel protein [Verrucomicrobiota bacterium]